MMCDMGGHLSLWMSILQQRDRCQQQPSVWLRSSRFTQEEGLVNSAGHHVAEGRCREHHLRTGGVW